MNPEQLTAYIDGELPEEEQLLLEEQLRTDPALLAQMKQVLRDELLFAEHFSQAASTAQSETFCSLEELPNEEVFMQYVGGQLTQAQAQEVEDQLQSNTDLEKEFAEFCRQRYLMAEALSSITAVPAPKKLKISRAPQRAARLHPTSPQGFPLLRIAAAIAILLVGGWFYYSGQNPFARDGGNLASGPASGETIAVMTVSSGEVAVIRGGSAQPLPRAFSQLPTSSQVKAGTKIQLHSHDLIVTGSGLALVKYADGTSVDVRSYSQASLTEREGRKHLTLHQGFAKAEVTKQPKGHPMQVFTPQLEVTVLGTAFLLEASDERTNLEMTEGVVAAFRPDSKQRIEVRAGETLTSGKRHWELTGKRPRVVSFSLIDTESKMPVPGFDPIAPGAILELAQLHRQNLTIRANTTPKLMTEVELELRGPTGYPQLSQIEHYYPYLVTNNQTQSHWVDAESYDSMPPLKPGRYTISATAKSPQGNAKPLLLQFQVR